MLGSIKRWNGCSITLLDNPERMIIINSIVPIFLLILLGHILCKSVFLSDAFFKDINRLVFWVALPALLISKISVAEIQLGSIGRITGLLTGGTLLSMILAWSISRALKLSAPKTGSFIQGSFRGNGAFIALPVIIYSLGTTDPEAETLATLVLALVVTLFNILGVLVLSHYSTDQAGTPGIPTLLWKLTKNPLIISCIAGLALNLFKITLPTYLFRPLDLLGHIALPLVLMSIGASLQFERLRGAASPSLIASLMKVGVTPALGFILASLFGCSHTETLIAIFYLAAPAAGMSYVMADVMNNDGPLAGRIVALSTLLSAITIPIIMAIGL